MDQQYQSEARWSKIINIASILAIAIASMGLFGLTLLSVVKRTKEIGIRKVLGADEKNIVFMLAKKFLILVILANVFAWPAAYLGMSEWLNQFAYKVNFSPWFFGTAMLISFVIACLTVGVLAFRAAKMNPVKSLRAE